jgi:hypothetical protein
MKRGGPTLCSSPRLFKANRFRSWILDAIGPVIFNLKTTDLEDGIARSFGMNWWILFQDRTRAAFTNSPVTP